MQHQPQTFIAACDQCVHLRMICTTFYIMSMCLPCSHNNVLYSVHILFNISFRQCGAQTMARKCFCSHDSVLPCVHKCHAVFTRQCASCVYITMHSCSHDNVCTVFTFCSGYPPGQGVCQAPGKVPGSTPGGTNFIPSRVIGLILNERCQEWRRLNRRPPAFCVNAAATGAAATAKVSDTTLCDNYRQYWGLVSDDERRRDHDNVRRKHGSWD